MPRGTRLKKKGRETLVGRLFPDARKKRGISLIEVLLAGSLFLVGVVSLMAMLLYGEEGTVMGGEQVRAALMAEEGVEAVRSMRDEAWNEITAGTGALAVTDGEWTFLPGETETIDGFYRRAVIIEDVCRDATDAIAECPASYTDIHTKKAIVRVTWEKRGISKIVERATYLTNWSAREWSQTDWSGGQGQTVWSNENQYDTDVSIAEGETVGQIQLAREGGVRSQAWEFETPGNYSYDPAKIEVTGGYGQLKGSAVERTNAWPFVTASEYAYDPSLIEVNGGAATLINVPASGTNDWTFDTAGEYTYDPAKIEVTGGSAALLSIADVNTVGLWHLDGATSAAAYEDYSGNDNDLSPFGNPVFGGAGHFDTAPAFDSSGDYGQIQDNTQTGLDVTGPLTIDAWVRKTAYTSGDDYIARKWTSGANRSYFLRVNSSGALTFYVQNGSYSQNISSSGGVVPVGSWVHVAAVYDGSFLRLFVNGLSVASPRAYNRGIQNGNAAFWISSSSTNSFNGMIDELRISNVARWTSNFTPPASPYGNFPTDKPTIVPTASLTGGYVGSWSSFTETATKNGGEIYYQLSDDDGATWKYWDGSAWVAAGATNYNTAAEVNTRIASFPTGAKRILWKAFLSSSGSQEVILSNVRIGYTNSTSGYATNLPPISPDSSFVQPELLSWSSFTETATKNGGEIYYQLSDDDGATWKYWDGGSWSAAGVMDYNTATDVDANIGEFPTTSTHILFKAFLESDGTQAVSLEDISIGYFSEPDAYTRAVWHFDDIGGLFMDLSGNGNHLIPHGGPTYGIGGVFGDAVEFDSSGDYGDIDDLSHNGLDITGELTIDAWVFKAANGSDYIVKKWTSGADRSYALYTNSNGGIVFALQGSSSGATMTTPNGSLPTGGWHHVAAVYDGSYLRVFVDGASAGAPVAYAGGIQDGEAPFQVSDAGLSSFNGYIDELRISDTARWTSDFAPLAFPYSDVATYPSDDPAIQPASSFEPATVEEWNSFIEEAEKNGGEIYYQLSDNGGLSWRYWDGGAWSVAGATDHNTADEVNNHINTFPAMNNRILFRAFLSGDGTQPVRLNAIRLSYTTEGGGFYGNQFIVESTGESSRLSNANRDLSLRFTAQETKTLDEIRVYQEAYSGLNNMRVGIQEDDGGGEPSGIYLSSGTYWALANGWNSVDISNVALSEGSVYHIVIERASGTGWATYRYSLPENRKVPLDGTDDDQMNVLWSSNGGGSWSLQGWQPIYLLEYTDGLSAGNPYYDSISNDANYSLIYDDRERGQVFTITGGDRLVTAMGFYVRKISSSTPEDDLYAVLYDVSTSEEVASGVLVPAADASQTFNWERLYFGTNVTLADGHQYRVSLRSPGTASSHAYDIYVMETPNNNLYYSSSYGDSLSTYCRSLNGGDSWTCYNYYDMAFRFVDYTGSSMYAELGYLTSSAFNMTDISPIQTISWDENVPVCTPECDIYLQVRSAPDASGSPGTWTDWYGAEGAGSFFSAPAGAIVPRDLNGNQWMQYKATLIGDGTNTPALQEVRITYK